MCLVRPIYASEIPSTRPHDHARCPCELRPLCRKRLPTDDIPRRMLVLLLELLKSGELPELAVGGAWSCINEIMARGSAALGTVALEMDICGLGVAQLQAIGSAADWVVSKQLQLPIQTDCLAELEYSTRGHIMM